MIQSTVTRPGSPYVYPRTPIFRPAYAMRGIGADPVPSEPLKTLSTVYAYAAPVSSLACAYHGYKRNESIGWAVWWGLMGGLFPLFTPVIALAQGFGKRAR